MKKSDIGEMPEYFDRYINLVSDRELLDAFDESLTEIENLDSELLERLGGKTYAPDKWTVKTIIQHIIDFERILGYRTLLFARGDSNRQQGVDEQLLALKSQADERRVEDLLSELKSVRQATRAMFAAFSEEMLGQKGTNWKYEMSALAMGFTIVGHQIHHFNLIRGKYLPLIEN